MRRWDWRFSPTVMILVAIALGVLIYWLSFYD